MTNIKMIFEIVLLLFLIFINNLEIKTNRTTTTKTINNMFPTIASKYVFLINKFIKKHIIPIRAITILNKFKIQYILLEVFQESKKVFLQRNFYLYCVFHVLSLFFLQD